MVSSGLTESYETLVKEANLDPKPVPTGTLEKKWSSIIKLQKKIMALESEIAQVRPQGIAPKKSIIGLPKAPERFKLEGHQKGINGIAFHPSYSIIATASDDATIKLWDSEFGHLERTIKGHTKAVTDIVYSKFGLYLISASADLSIKIWDVENDYVCKRTLHGHDNIISGLTITPLDLIVSCSRDETIRVWELATGFSSAN